MIEVAVRNAGLRGGMRAMWWVLTWSAVREADGEPPNVDRVAEWWRESRRTAFREQESFRKAFPSFETPEKIYEQEAVRKFAKQAARLGELQDGKEGKDSRSTFDTSIIQLGLLPCPV